MRRGVRIITNYHIYPLRNNFKVNIAHITAEDSMLNSSLIRSCTCRREKLFAINIYFSGWDMFNSTFAKLYLIFYGLLILVYLSALCVSLFLIPAFSTFWKIPRGKTIRHRHVLHADQKNICSWLQFRRRHLKRNTPVSINNWNVFNRKKHQMVIWASGREFMSLSVAGSIFSVRLYDAFCLIKSE